MEKRSSYRRVSKSVVEKDIEIKDEIAGQSPPETVRIVCVDSANRTFVTSPITGIEYQFVGNQPLEVNMEDVNFLLSKKRGCCGTPPQPIFIKV